AGGERVEDRAGAAAPEAAHAASGRRSPAIEIETRKRSVIFTTALPKLYSKRPATSSAASAPKPAAGGAAPARRRAARHVPRSPAATSHIQAPSAGSPR